jgi:hypothetical protein
MRHRTLRITQCDADCKPVGESVVIAIDAATEHFDWTLDDPVVESDRAGDVPAELPDTPG